MNTKIKQNVVEFCDVYIFNIPTICQNTLTAIKGLNCALLLIIAKFISLNCKTWTVSLFDTQKICLSYNHSCNINPTHQSKKPCINPKSCEFMWSVNYPLNMKSKNYFSNLVLFKASKTMRSQQNNKRINDVLYTNTVQFGILTETSWTFSVGVTSECLLSSRSVSVISTMKTWLPESKEVAARVVMTSACKFYHLLFWKTSIRLTCK